MTQSIDNNTIVLTDKKSHVAIADDVELCMTAKSSKDTAENILKRVYLFISNPRDNLIGNDDHRLNRTYPLK